MKSPFPGMDPYLEQHWCDVHHGLITYTRDQLQPVLPRDLRARMEERVFVESDEVEYRTLYPDVSIVERPAPARSAEAPESGVAVAEPLIVHIKREPLTQGTIEIVDAASGNRVITVIEFLSPANKFAGEGQDLYRQKQREVIESPASLVEIDLTRSGRRVMLLPPERIPRSHRTTYQVCVQRGWEPDKALVYPVPLSQRLPVINIPLRQTDADVPLDLQALIDRCYENGRYDDIDYQVQPVPVLEPPENKWADELLQSKGLRTA